MDHIYTYICSLPLPCSLCFPCLASNHQHPVLVHSQRPGSWKKWRLWCLLLWCRWFTYSYLPAGTCVIPIYSLKVHSSAGFSHRWAGTESYRSYRRHVSGKQGTVAAGVLSSVFYALTIAPLDLSVFVYRFHFLLLTNCRWTNMSIPMFQHMFFHYLSTSRSHMFGAPDFWGNTASLKIEHFSNWDGIFEKPPLIALPPGFPILLAVNTLKTSFNQCVISTFLMFFFVGCESPECSRQRDCLGCGGFRLPESPPAGCIFRESAGHLVKP